ncbi:bZIP transcription factor [Stagonosporopsis vannaccii]|nr:bZIP transcription factor [Stagonosporopsis vannaccii]
MMEVQQPQSFDWANDAYSAFSEASKHQNKWVAFSNNSMPMDSNTAFTVPPALLTNATARFGQITPPEERSPAEPTRNVREGSIPVEELINESLWPANGQQYMQSPPQNTQHLQSPPEDIQSSPKRRRTTRQSASQPQISAVTHLDDNPTANPQPPKRKRGRPKSQPQMVEAYTADGFPFQVSSARQSHLEKNRVAAHKCRQRKKEYIGSLESRAREFSAKNKALKENVSLLREEVLGLKNEVLRHAGCGFWAVDEYLARCAGDLLGREAPGMPRMNSGQYDASPTMQQMRPREDSNISVPSLGSLSSSPGTDDFGGLELLKDFDDDQSLQ